MSMLRSTQETPPAQLGVVTGRLLVGVDAQAMGLTMRAQGCRRVRARAYVWAVCLTGGDRLPAGRPTAEVVSRSSCHTRPGSLGKSQIPVRTRAEWENAVSGFVVIDLVGHDDGITTEECCFTLTATDLATGRGQPAGGRATRHRSEFAGCWGRVVAVPFAGIGFDNGSEFITCGPILAPDLAGGNPGQVKESTRSKSQVNTTDVGPRGPWPVATQCLPAVGRVLDQAKQKRVLRAASL